MMKKSLYKELKRIPRVSEDSSIVASAWVATVDPYLPEIPDVESGNEQCRELYFNITAERLLFRKKLLGLPVDENLVADASIAAAHPFGEAGPTFGELAVSSVRLAAAFVPFTPDERDMALRPVMARLYCVAGLFGRYVSPFTEGLEEAGIQNYNWFVAGLNDDDLKMGISGRSWLLAANLLMQIIEKNDMATARNLINNFVVTGNVEDGAISDVTIGRKPELANIKEFRNLKWIIPMKNANDMTVVPARRIEKPATLDEAYKLIETMRSTATRSFFRFLREGNLDGVKEQCRIGADLFAREEGTDLTCLEVVADAKSQLYAEKKEKKLMNGKFIEEDVDNSVNANLTSFKKSIRDRIAALDEVSQWLRLQGVDSSMMFYLMAINGDEASIVRSLEYSSINACDEHGLTAVDLALVGEDFEAAKLLHCHGGTPNTRWRANSRLASAIDGLCDPIDGASQNDIKLIIAAIGAGLSHKTRVRIPFYHGVPHIDEYCSLYACAVGYAQYDVIEACLKNGADPNEVLCWTREERLPGGELDEVVDNQATSWSILSQREDMKGDRRRKFRELLQLYGAKIDEA